MKSKISPNSVSLAGEFAVLSQLALHGYDAGMTIGNTKGVDILVSHPLTHKMYQLEVKTNYKSPWKKPRKSILFGVFVSDWIMNVKHEKITISNLFYCFVNNEKGTNIFKYYIVPSKLVADYIRKQHKLWLKEKKKEGKKIKDTDIRIFRMGLDGEKYRVPTPKIEKFENNWMFKE